MRDVIVVTRIDAKRKPAEGLDIFLLSTEGEKEVKTYRGLEELQADYPNKKILKKASALFHQPHSMADKMISQVKAAGISLPEAGIALAKLEEGQESSITEGLISGIEAIREKCDDWYILLTDRDDEESVKALAAWAESTEPTEAQLGTGIEDHRKLYFGQTNSKELRITNPRAVITYTDKLEECADAAYLGCVGPFYPRSVTWKFKKPDGLTLPDLTEGERDALDEANINFLSEEYKNQYMKPGICANGEFIDVQMGADYITKLMREGLYKVLLENPKIPYSDGGFTMVAYPVFAALDQATRLGIIANDPRMRRGIYQVTVPKFADATEEEIRSRTMPPITWQAQLDGAVHSVKTDGTLKVKLDLEEGAEG